MSTSKSPPATSLSLWIVNQYALPPDQAGITRNYALAERMVTKGIESLIVAAQTSYLSRSTTGLSVDGRLDLRRTVPFLWIPAPRYKGNGLRRVFNMLIFALLAVVLPIFYFRRGRISRPDVILGSSPNLFAGFSALALARILKAHFVLEIRDLHPLSITALTGVSPRHPYIRLLGLIEKVLYRRADLIVSPLQGVGEHVRKTIGSARPWIWIPNSVDVGQVLQPPPTRSAPSPFTLVYAGAHGVANDLHILVKAAELLRDEDVRFILYGDGVAKTELRSYVERHGIQNVKFCDPVPKTEIYDRLAYADALVFILPDNALYEHGLSANKLYDYLASARPVLIATNSVHNPIAAAGAGVTVSPGSATALADGVRRIAQLSPDEREVMGQRGRAHVRRHYHLPNLADSLADRLRTLR